MNKKLKVLSSIICGLVLSSGIALTSVQAATVQSAQPTQINSAAISIASTSQESLLNAKISKSALLYWDTIENADEYSLKIMLQSPTNPLAYTKMTSFSGNFKNEQADTKNFFKSKGIYYIRVRALDSNKNIIAHDVVFVYYDGTSTIQMDPFDEY